MSNNKKPINEGYIPTVSQEGHQPARKPEKEVVTNGYQPTTSQGSNPTNTPPKKR